MGPARKETVTWTALLLAAALVYLNGLNNPFITDDRYIIFRNFQPWQSWTLESLFTRSLFSSAPSESTYFRPLSLLTFALNYPVAKANPLGYRVVNLVFHLIVIGGAFFFLSRIATTWVASFAVLLFALHPANVQATAYISSRSDPLYTALGLWSLFFWSRGNDSQEPRRSLFLALALALFFLGLFAKETIVVVPALAVIMDLTYHCQGSWKDKIRENLGPYTGFIVLFALYLTVRLWQGFPLLMEGARHAQRRHTCLSNKLGHQSKPSPDLGSPGRNPVARGKR